jgi:hypothetical protein
MRRGIYRWVIAASRDAGAKLQQLTPPGIAAFLVASAIAPIAQPLLNPGASGLSTALVGQFDAVGAGYLTELLMRMATALRASPLPWSGLGPEHLTQSVSASRGRTSVLEGDCLVL